MKNDIDLLKLTFDALDRKKWKTDVEIASKLNISNLDGLIKILLIGQSKAIFAYEKPNKWKLCKKTNLDAFKIFCNSFTFTIEVPEKILRRYYISRQNKINQIKSHTTIKKTIPRKIKSGVVQYIKKSEVDYQLEDYNNMINLRSDGFHDGRKKQYNGPKGQYWSDPNYKKREWE